MFRAHVLVTRRPKFYYKTFGIITPIGGRPVHGKATYRCDDTRGCIVQFWPPDDEHVCSKHVEAWNKLVIKFSASSWLILRYIRLYSVIGQDTSLCINYVLQLHPAFYQSLHAKCEQLLLHSLTPTLNSCRCFSTESPFTARHSTTASSHRRKASATLACESCRGHDKEKRNAL